MKFLFLIVGIILIFFGNQRNTDYKKLLMIADINDPLPQKKFIKRLRNIAYICILLGILFIGFGIFSFIDFDAMWQ